MRFLGGCLGLLKALGANVPSKKEFMDLYTTTIGKTIYYGEGWPEGEEVTPLVVHELCHVLQFRSFWMPIKYLFSSIWRIHYESACVQAEVLCFPGTENRGSWFDDRVEQFTGYWIRSGLVAHALLSRLQGIDEGKLDPDARLLLGAYTEYKKIV